MEHFIFGYWILIALVAGLLLHHENHHDWPTVGFAEYVESRSMLSSSTPALMRVVRGREGGDYLTLLPVMGRKFFLRARIAGIAFDPRSETFRRELRKTFPRHVWLTVQVLGKADEGKKTVFASAGFYSKYSSSVETDLGEWLLSKGLATVDSESLVLLSPEKAARYREVARRGKSHV